MSDDESHAHEETEAPEQDETTGENQEETQVTSSPEQETTADDQTEQPADENEAKRAMEEAAQRKAEKVAQEIAEFEEQRKHEREKEQEEIRQLREKREQRKREREEEEKRLTGMRAQEEARRKADEEERRRKKLEEETKRKEERERKRREQEERIKNMRKPNFVITKKSGDNAVDEADVTKEEVQKSKEQLEEEKRAILAQRIKPLPDLHGCDSGKLTEQAKELHKEIHRLMSEKYDLEQKFKRQQYDMIELAERARQMSKGKSRRGVSSAQVDESFDRLADKFAGAPPKIQLCSKYERHTDHRTYSQRLVLFEELSKPLESPKIGRKHGGEEEGGEIAQAEEEE